MKSHKNQWLVCLLSLHDIPCGATNQGTHHGVRGADAFAVPWHRTILSDMSLQLLENKVLSWGIRGKSAPLLAEITIRKSQILAVAAFPVLLILERFAQLVIASQLGGQQNAT